MHRFRNTIATTHFRHKGSGKTDNELPALLYSTVHPDPLLAQDFWGDLERHKSKEKKNKNFLSELGPLARRVLPHAACRGEKLHSATAQLHSWFLFPSAHTEVTGVRGAEVAPLKPTA